MTATIARTAPFNTNTDAVPLLSIAQSAVLLNVEPARLLAMIFDPEVDAEKHWHIVREGDDIHLPVWLVRELLAGGWRCEALTTNRAPVRGDPGGRFGVQSSRSAATASASRMRYCPPGSWIAFTLPLVM